jgi:hypothetical protein
MVAKNQKEFSGEGWMKSWRLPNQGMIWAALGTDADTNQPIQPRQALWVGNHVLEDKNCAKEIKGLSFYFADDFFQLWVNSRGENLGTESAVAAVHVNNVAVEQEDVEMKEDNGGGTTGKKRTLTNNGGGNETKKKKSNNVWDELL